jgi:glyoxalase family protein
MTGEYEGQNMEKRILGLHHVTAIAGDPQRNLDFYTGVLGLHLVKLTVNFDDPGSYHFYFGDAQGRPGTLLTFFPWPGASRGRQGTRQATATAFAVPENAMGYWRERLHSHHVGVEGPGTRFDEEFLAFQDPDGLPLELVTQRGIDEGSGWSGGPVPPEFAIGGIHSVTLELEASEGTGRLLTETMGFRAVRDDGHRFRYAAPEDASAHPGIGRFVDIVCSPSGQRGVLGAGTIHHIAFRARNDEEQAAWHQELSGLGYSVSPVMDREYFHSIYFHEPGHVLFEIATDPPGFAIDEAPDQLGTHLMLPTQYEARRVQIEQALPPVRLPKADRATQ